MPDNASLLETGPVVHASPDVPQTQNEILNRLAFFVGCIAFGLPIVLFFGATVGGSCFRDSISHFYYAQFLGPIFVGLLFFIGGFLLAYSGEHPLEDRGSSIAGLGAFAVTLFPTTDTGCEALGTFKSRVFVEVTQGDPLTLAAAQNQDFFDLFPGVGDYHMAGAGLLFVYLALFCLYVLRRIIPEQHIRDGRLIDSKRRRNRLYAWCGIIILACVAVLALKGPAGGDDFVAWWNSLNLTFYVEAIALWAFGLAWFAKGRVFESLNDHTA